MHRKNKKINMKKKLEQEIKKIDKKLKYGDRIELLYDGEEIARYDFTERSMTARHHYNGFVGVLCLRLTSKVVTLAR